MKRTDGPRFNPDDPYLYFVAFIFHHFQNLNEIQSVLVSQDTIPHITTHTAFNARLRDPDFRLFVDSGVYGLAAKIAKQLKIDIVDALAMPPAEIKNFNIFENQYVQKIQTYRSQLWGYVEIDFGSTEDKIQTRERLEQRGLRPIPVYNIYNDSIAYFEYLASEYDRVCVSGLVQRNQATRVRAIATLDPYMRKYPNTWFHFLGVKPNSQLLTSSAKSADSSSWLYISKRPLGDTGLDCAFGERVCITPEWAYDKSIPKCDTGGALQAMRAGLYVAHFIEKRWQALKRYENGKDFNDTTDV